ncbi:MAG: MFS transporter [Candidatus Thermoplasmatota archaeon]|jgi:MFS family permease|nr:MFS transporter [Candidatus Thermoplasmatota archaeon]
MVVENHDKLPLNFKYMVSNAGLSRFGFSTFNIAILWVIMAETRLPIMAGLGDGILSAPLFFSFIVGAIVDKSSRKRRIALLSGTLRAVAISSIYAALLVHNIPLALIAIYATGFFIGFTSDILNSVRAVWFKEFLTENNYKKGNALDQSVLSLAEGAGYVTGSIFLDLGFQNTFLAVIFIFLISIIPVLMIRVSETSGPDHTDIINSTREGLSFIRGSRPITQLIYLMLATNLIFGMLGVVFTALVQLHFKLPPHYAGLIFAILVFGIFIGSALSVNIKGRVGDILFSSLLLLGLLVTSVYFLNNIYLTLFPVFISGAIVGVLNVAVSTAMLKIVPVDMMARVQGSFNTFGLGATAFAGMIGGSIVQVTGPLHSFLYLGAGVICISFLTLIFRELGSLQI